MSQSVDDIINSYISPPVKVGKKSLPKSDPFEDQFSRFQSDFQKQFNKPLPVSGGSEGLEGIHKKLYKGRARDISFNQTNEQEQDWIIKNGPNYGMRIGDFRKNWKDIGGSGPHIHIDSGRGGDIVDSVIAEYVGDNNQVAQAQTGQSSKWNEVKVQPKLIPKVQGGEVASQGATKGNSLIPSAVSPSTNFGKWNNPSSNTIQPKQAVKPISKPTKKKLTDSDPYSKQLNEIDTVLSRLQSNRDKLPADYPTEAIDQQIRAYSQAKNDLLRMKAGGKPSLQAPSEGGRTPDDPKDLPWYLKGYAADIGYGGQSVINTVAKGATFLGRSAGLKPNETHVENLQKLDQMLEETKARGGKGVGHEIARGASSMATHLPLYAVGGIPGMAALGAAEVGGGTEPAEVKDIVKSAAINAAMGKILKVGHNLSIPKKILLGSATGVGVTAATGGTREEAIAQGILFSGLSALGSKKKGETITDNAGNMYRVISNEGENLELQHIPKLEPTKPKTERDQIAAQSEEVRLRVEKERLEREGLRVVSPEDLGIPKGGKPTREKLGARVDIPKDEMIEKGYPAIRERRQFNYGRSTEEGEGRRSTDVAESNQFTMTPEGSGTTHLSNEELSRTERFYKVGKGSGVTSLGKQPDAPLQSGEAVVAINQKGEARIVNSSGIVDQKALIEKAQSTLKEQSNLSIQEQVMSKASPDVVETVKNAPLKELVEKSGLSPKEAEKGRNDVLADAQREFSPEAIAVKRPVVKGELENAQTVRSPETQNKEQSNLRVDILPDVETAQQQNRQVKVRVLTSPDGYAIRNERTGEIIEVKYKEEILTAKGLDKDQQEAAINYLESKEAKDNWYQRAHQNAESSSHKYVLSPKSISKDHYSYNILNESREPVGRLNIESRDGGKTGYIRWIGEEEGGLRNQLGISGVKELLGQIKANHPEFERITGERISGTHEAAGRSGDTVEIGVKEKPKPEVKKGEKSEGQNVEKTLKPDEREREFPKSLEEQSLPGGNDRTYKVASNTKTIAEAERVISEKGIDGAIEYVTGSDALTPERVATGAKVIDQLYSDALRLKDSNPTEANRLIEKADQVATDLSVKLTKYGQAIQAASLVEELSTQKAVEIGQKILDRAKHGTKLKPEKQLEIAKYVDQIKKAKLELAELEQQISKANKQAQDLQSGKGKGQSAKPKEKAFGEKNKLFTVEQKNKDLEFLKTYFDTHRGSGGPGTDYFQAAARLGAHYLEAGARSVAEWTERMIQELGEDARPFIDQIKKDSYELLKKSRSEGRERKVRPLTAIDEIRTEIMDAKRLEREAVRTENRKLKLEERAKRRWDYQIREDAKSARTRKDSIDSHADMVDVGAERLTKVGSVTDNQPYTVDQWKREMVSEFGDEFNKNWKQVYKNSFEKIKEAKDSYKEGMKAERDSDYTKDLTSDEEITEALKKREVLNNQIKESRKNLAKVYNSLDRWGQISRNIKSLQNLPRALKSSIDLSASGRQGAIGMVAHPLRSARAIKQQLIALTKNPEAYREMEANMMADPMFDSARKNMGVDFTLSESSGAHDLLLSEEAFGSKIADMVPGVRKSEQAYVTMLNEQRLGMAKTYDKWLRRMGATPESHPREFKAAGEIINVFTGRAPMRTGTAAFLSHLFFAPRLWKSRLQLINPAFYGRIAIQSPRAAALLMTDMLKFSSAVGGTLWMIHNAGKAGIVDADTSLDPDDPDFLKVRIGNTHYDISGGLQQELRFMFQMAKAVEDQQKGKLHKRAGWTFDDKGNIRQNPMQIVGEKLRRKASPIAGEISNFLIGDTLDMLTDPQSGKSERKPYSLKPYPSGFGVGGYRDDKGKWHERDVVPQGPLGLVSPLIFKDFIEAYNEDEVKGVAKAVPSVFGVGTITYKKKLKKKN